jgi:UDP-N-acetylglucosamine--N-acetylmuramyl-(pentapeptide) pyrophosphoryl-undecaprenol N-acetylglucosamine transferase
MVIFLSSGGTGGHVFPAEALARELAKRGHVVHLLTDHRGKAFGEVLPDVVVHRVSAETATGGLAAKVRAVRALIKGIGEAKTILREHKPAALVSFGGYPSLPGAVAAWRLGVPLILHDQNAVLGRANRMVARFATVVATSFSTVLGLSKRTPSVLTGNPVRPAIAALRAMPYDAPQTGGAIHLLVTGGSQGARVFSEVVPKAMAELDVALRDRLHISQQVRAESMAEVQEAYAALDMSKQVELQPFFTDMPRRLASCHLFIGRAGGSTVAELTAVGRPAIYVPLPIAILDEQTAQSRLIEKAGGCWVVPQSEFTPPKLAQLLKRILTDPESLAAAARAAHAQGRIDAAERLADVVLEHAKS